MKIWGIFSSVDSENECAEVVKGTIPCLWILVWDLFADSPVMEECGEWMPVSWLRLIKNKPCTDWFRGLLQILVWLLFGLACSAHQLGTVWDSRVAAGTICLSVNECTFCSTVVCGRLFLEEGYPEDKIYPALTVVNRPPGPFQAICPWIGHAFGGNDPKRW